MLPKKVVIAGAGFAGVRVALELYKSKFVEVTLINESSYHCFHADLYEVATAILDKERKIDFQNLESTVNIPLKKIFKNKNVKLIIDKVVSINLVNNSLTTKDTGQIKCDYLALALGSTTNYLGIDGAKDFGHPLKTAEDALNIRNDIEELLTQAKNSPTIAVAGGGFTGVELAGEMAIFLKKMARRLKKDKANLVVIEGSNMLLPGMVEWAQQAALKRLNKLGVEVCMNKLIKKVEKDKLILENKAQMMFDYLIWTTGVTGVEVSAGLKELGVNKKNQIVTVGDLSIDSFPNVLVVGDFSECIDKNGCPIAQTAWAAITQGKLAAKNILAKIHGEESKNYQHFDLGFVVPIGGKYALSDVFNLKLAGLFAWIIKRLISLKYLLSILPVSDALSLWWKGVNIYSKND